MTNRINLVINLSILALLIYLSVAVKQLQDKKKDSRLKKTKTIGIVMIANTDL